MAFYRCGGGGIPSSLKTDMNAVLNKKFGTSTDYPPADWAPTVNLMGPLPEKTIVSSPIADFSDGADDVPTKSLVVTIPPTLSGVSSVSETQTGRNICSVAPWVRDTTFYGSNWTEMVAFLNTLPVGNYSVSYDYEITALIGSSIDVSYSPYIRALVNGSYVNVTAYSAPQTDSSPTVGKIYHCSASFSITSQTVGNIANFYLYCGQSGIKVAEVTVKNAMVELGSTVSTYEPYTPTTYTASLGRTIYGGQVDIVNGEANPLNILLPYNADSAEITVNGIKRSYSLDNQEFTFNGTNTKTDSSWLIFSINASDFVLNGLKSGVTYRFSHNLTADFYAQLTYNKSGGGVGAMGYLRGTAGRNASVSFTLPSDFSSLKQFQIGVSNTATDVDITAHFQIEIGSSASAYSPYFTPFTFDGQEVPTRLGYNAFWSDDGDTEATYRADINLALGGQ